MRASGNGLPEVCVANLLRTFRGEVPYERLKGLNPQNIDKPMGLVTADVEADAQWCISTYEPRVKADEVTYSDIDIANGDFGMTIE